MINALSRSHRDEAQIQLRISANVAEADQLIQYIEHLLCNDIIPRTYRFNISVCIAEAINNIVEHGHYTSPHRPIRCTLSINRPFLKVDLFDMARAYTPPVKPDFDIRQENGRGWHLLQKLSDEICYTRSGRVNHLSIYFKLPCDHQ